MARFSSSTTPPPAPLSAAGGRARRRERRRHRGRRGRRGRRSRRPPTTCWPPTATCSAPPANFGYMSGALKHFFDSTFLAVGGALSDDGSADGSERRTAAAVRPLRARPLRHHRRGPVGAVDRRRPGLAPVRRGARGARRRRRGRPRGGVRARRYARRAARATDRSTTGDARGGEAVFRRCRGRGSRRRRCSLRCTPAGPGGERRPGAGRRRRAPRAGRLPGAGARRTSQQPDQRHRAPWTAQDTHRRDLRRRRAPDGSTTPTTTTASWARSPTAPAAAGSSSSSAPTRAWRMRTVALLGVVPPVGGGVGARAPGGTAATWSVAVTEHASPTPCPKTAKGVLLGRPDDRWLVCVGGADRRRRRQVPCTESHDWRAATTIVVGEPEDPYPGDRWSRSDPRLLLGVGRRLAELPGRLRVRLHVVPRGRVGGRQPALDLLGEDRPMTRTARPRCWRRVARRCSRWPPATRTPDARTARRHARQLAHVRPAGRPRRRRARAGRLLRPHLPTRRSPRPPRRGRPCSGATPPQTFHVGRLRHVSTATCSPSTPSGPGPGGRRLPAPAHRVRRRRPRRSAGSACSGRCGSPRPLSSPTRRRLVPLRRRRVAGRRRAAPASTGRSTGCSTGRGGRDRYGLCGTAAPGAAASSGSLCAGRTPGGRSRRSRCTAGTVPRRATRSAAGDGAVRGRGSASQAAMPARLRVGLGVPPTEGSGAAGQTLRLLLGAERLSTADRGAQKPSLRSWRGSRCQSLATLTRRSR